MKTKLTLFVLVIALFGIFDSLYFRVAITTIPYQIQIFLQVFHLQFIQYNYNATTYINLTANFLFLISGILYYFSKTKEDRLLRFLFSIIFLEKVISAIWIFVLFSINISHFPPGIFNSVLAFISSIAWCILSFKILKKLDHSKVLKTETFTYGPEDEQTYSIPATNLQRVFHLIIDVFVVILCFSSAFEAIVRHERTVKILEQISQYIGERGTIQLIFLSCSIMYYLLFEKIFNASAGKFLTETRIIKDDGSPIVFKSVLIRSFSRFVPFDALSFLFSRSGWHDRWSSTTVVQEERTGVKGGLYFWVLPLLVILIVGSTFLTHTIEAYFKNKAFIEAEQTKQNLLKDRLNHLTMEDIIQLGRNGDHSHKIYLKPEQIDIHSTLFSVINTDDDFDYQENNIRIEKFYLTNKGGWPQQKFTKQELSGFLPNTFTGNYDATEGKIFPGRGENYVVETIEPHFQPNIKLATINFDDKSVSITLSNFGWEANIMTLQGIGKEKLKWGYTDRKIITNYYNSQQIYAHADQGFEQFGARLTVQDSTGRIQIYDIEGKYGDRESTIIKRLK